MRNAEKEKQYRDRKTAFMNMGGGFSVEKSYRFFCREIIKCFAN